MFVSDIDECLTKGGKFGHHCNGNTKCVNTVGSYMCRCATGFTPDNPYSCTEEGTEEPPVSKSNSLHTTIHNKESVIALLMCLIVRLFHIIVYS